jgi:hydrogenase maturation protease
MPTPISSMSERRRPIGTVVIGLGNPLMADDGIGLMALERLRAAGVPEGVDLVDGGTWGLNLLPIIEAAERVLFLDAINAGGEPGTLHCLEREQLPRYLSTKVSPHQIDLREVLALAELRGTLPRETVAIGLQPAAVELATEPSDALLRRLDDLLAAVTKRLASWGHDCQPRAIQCTS